MASLDTSENDHKSKRQKIDHIEIEIENTLEETTEKDVGITEYISGEKEGFTGFLKQRYTDFLVNEVSKDGDVVHLEDLGLVDLHTKKEERQIKRDQKRSESDNQKENENENENKNTTSGVKLKFTPDAELRKNLCSLIGEDNVNKVEEIVEKGGQFITEEQYLDKENRTKIHFLLRDIYGTRIDSLTVDNKLKILRSGVTNEQRNNYNQRRRGAQSCSEVIKVYGHPKPFVKFVLYKENKETMEACNLIVKLLRVNPKSLTFAGVKDRRGVTVQNCTIAHQTIDRLLTLNKALIAIKIGGFEYTKHSIGLGDLIGNEFLITLRNVLKYDSNLDSNKKLEILEEKKKIISNSFDSLKEYGFINYFGMQRFGTFSVPSYKIGQCILSYKFEDAVNLILMPQAKVFNETREARQIWADTKDPSLTAEKMPYKAVAETCILKALKKQPSNYQGALLQIPYNLRLLYVHSYQSYIWNRVASERRKLGLKLIEGDIVYDDGRQNNDNKIKKDEIDEDYIEDVKQDYMPKVYMVTKEDIEKNIYSIYDIILPSPGCKVKYPTNTLGKIYQHLMKTDGLDPYKMERNISEFSLSGAYRHVFAKPKLLEYYFKQHVNLNQQFVYTDFDQLGKSNKDVFIPESEFDTTITSEQDSNNVYLSVVLRLRLLSSQYATMAIREAMKADTSRYGPTFNVQTV